MGAGRASWKVKTIAVALTGLACLGLLEIGARIVARAWGLSSQDLRFDWQRTLYIPHPHIGYTLRPNYERASFKDGTLHVNALGYRGEEIALQTPPGTLRLVCLGGSTTFSTEVGDWSTYPYLLQEMLKATYPHRPMLSMPGWGPHDRGKPGQPAVPRAGPATGCYHHLPCGQ